MIDILSRRLAIQASAAAGAAATQAANATSSAVAAATSSTGVVTALSCTASGATSASIAANYLAIVTTGFGSAGDGGHGMYKRVASQPPSLGRFRSSDRYLPNGTADNTTMLNALLISLVYPPPRPSARPLPTFSPLSPHPAE